MFYSPKMERRTNDIKQIKKIKNKKKIRIKNKNKRIKEE